MYLISWNEAGWATTHNLIVSHFGSLQNYLQLHNVDILALQETKAIEQKLAEEPGRYGARVEGYESFWTCCRGSSRKGVKRGYSGVAVYAATRSLPVNHVNDRPFKKSHIDGLTHSKCMDTAATVTALNDEGRCIVVGFDKFCLVNVYAPALGGDYNHLQFKAVFYLAVTSLLQEIREYRGPVILVGDFNVVARGTDCHWLTRVIDIAELRYRALRRDHCEEDSAATHTGPYGGAVGYPDSTALPQQNENNRTSTLTNPTNIASTLNASEMPAELANKLLVLLPICSALLLRRRHLYQLPCRDNPSADGQSEDTSSRLDIREVLPTRPTNSMSTSIRATDTAGTDMCSGRGDNASTFPPCSSAAYNLKSALVDPPAGFLSKYAKKAVQAWRAFIVLKSVSEDKSTDLRCSVTHVVCESRTAVLPDVLQKADDCLNSWSCVSEAAVKLSLYETSVHFTGDSNVDRASYYSCMPPDVCALFGCQVCWWAKMKSSGMTGDVSTAISIVDSEVQSAATVAVTVSRTVTATVDGDRDEEAQKTISTTAVQQLAAQILDCSKMVVRHKHTISIETLCQLLDISSRLVHRHINRHDSDEQRDTIDCSAVMLDRGLASLCEAHRRHHAVSSQDTDAKNKNTIKSSDDVVLNGGSYGISMKEKRWLADTFGLSSSMSAFTKWMQYCLEGSIGLIDTFKVVHPSTTDRFTVWEQYTNGRYSNEGVRLDYIFVDSSMLQPSAHFVVQRGDKEVKSVLTNSSASGLHEDAVYRCQFGNVDARGDLDILGSAALTDTTAQGRWSPAPMDGSGMQEMSKALYHEHIKPPNTGLVYTPPRYSDHIACSLLLFGLHHLQSRPHVEGVDHHNSILRAQPHRQLSQISSFFSVKQQESKVVCATDSEAIPFVGAASTECSQICEANDCELVEGTADSDCAVMSKSDSFSSKTFSAEVPRSTLRRGSTGATRKSNKRRKVVTSTLSGASSSASADIRSFMRK
eukprot:Lankesteria_metandrocarpae@DN1510_c0_g1_i2.p1